MGEQRGDELTRLAQAVSDGSAVDWAAAEQEAAPGERAVIRELRVVSEIAGLHRTLPHALESTVELSESQVWGHLTLRDVLGRGAYGVVYRAWDPQLDREVALKLIAEGDEGQHAAQVVEEGRLLARVRHRGVVTVFGAARTDGYVGLWMELVEGRTLEEVLQEQGRFSAREAALIGVEVCEALAAVHSAGLLHRDVKAQNVMRDRNGRIVLMDFGTGRVRGLDGGTAVAELAGTPLYMAPEVFRGQPATIQSDVYGMGVLLFRLVTGSFPVVGRSLAEVRDGHQKGRMRRLRDQRSDLPAPFVHIVERALSPDPRRRFESAGALELALTGLLATSIDVPEAAPVRPWRRWSMVATAAAALAGGVLLGFLARGPAAPPPAERAPMRFLVPPPGVDAFESFALSPDGRHVAFISAGQLWVKPLATVGATLLAGTQGAHDPFWAPDGGSIAYFKQQSLWIVGISGGESRVICPAWNAMGGTWGRDGTILFAADLGRTIYRVPSAGGDRTPLRTQGPHGFDLRWPSFLPDGISFIYSARKTADAPRAVRVARLDGSLPDRALLDSDSNAQVAGDRILYVHQGILFAQPLDAATMELRGSRMQVAERVPANLYNRADYANFSAASNGRLLAYLGTRQADRELRLIDRQGREQVLLGPGEFRDLAMARSGEQLAYEQLDEVSGTRDIWTLDLARRQVTRITDGPDDEVAPVWSADERFIYYASNRNGRTGIYRRAADGTGDEVPVIVDANRAIPFDASPDGALLSFTRPHQKRDLDLWLLRLTTPGGEVAYRTSTWREGEPRFSPDGKWLAYSTTDTGDRHVYIERVDQPGPRWQVSERNGREPFWRADGREIYYHGPNRTLMAVDVDLRGTRPVLGSPRPLFVLNFRDWDVRAHYVPLPDGRAFIANVPVAGSTPAPLTFVLDWTDR